MNTPKRLCPSCNLPNFVHVYTHRKWACIDCYQKDLYDFSMYLYKINFPMEIKDIDPPLGYMSDAEKIYIDNIYASDLGQLYES